jgi:predicted RNA methylase
MDSSTASKASVLRSARTWLRRGAQQAGVVATTRKFLAMMWEFVRESTPGRLRQRYGDADYDWDYHVNTTSAAVGWHDRLLAVFHSAYQPTEPAAFHEMMEALRRQTGIDFRDFVFLDVGSGKGRTLLMASDYPFRRIIGVELLPSLHQIAQENLSRYRSELQECFRVESICADVADFVLPTESLLLYLFNPLPEHGLRRLLADLQQNLQDHPRAVYVIYYNPLLEYALIQAPMLRKIVAAHQYSIFGSHEA